MQSNVVKTRSSTTITTGLIKDETSPSPIWRCHQLENGCHKDTNETIQYGCGAPFNRCRHTREWSYVGLPATLASFTSRALEYRGGSYYTHSEPEFRILDSRLEYQRPIGTTSIVVPWDEVERARTDAYTRLQHLAPPPHMNVLRSAMELKDTKETVDSLISFTRWCKNLCNAGSIVLNGKRRLVTLATNVATFARYYLTYKFGIEPTVADTKQFLRELSEGKLSVKGSQAVAGYRKGQTVVVRYVTGPSASDLAAAMFPTTGGGSGEVRPEPIRLMAGSSALTVPFGNHPSGFSQGREVTVRREVGCYFAQLNRDLEFRGLDELKRRWTWNCPSFRTLWDVCPFSFLIDWFVDVGASIERIEKRYLMQNYAQYLGPIWWAQKVQTKVYHPALRRFDVSASKPQPPSDPSYGGTLNVGWTWEAAPHLVSQSEVFERRPVTVVPTALWPALGQRISAYQISTGMAMILSFAGDLARGR